MTEKKVYKVCTDAGNVVTKENPAELTPHRDHWVQCHILQFGTWIIKNESTGLYKETTGWKVTDLIQLNLDKVV